MAMWRGRKLMKKTLSFIFAEVEEEEHKEEKIADKGIEESWLRSHLHRLLKQRMFEMAIGGVIMFNLVLVILETDHEIEAIEAGNENASSRFGDVNKVLLAIYFVELMAKIFTYRCRFFLEYWNQLDFFIVSLDLVFLFFGRWLEDAPSLNFLRIFRLARLLRAFRMASLFPELNLLLKGFLGAAKAIFWGVLMVCLLLSVWSILAVKLIHPINQRVANKGLYEGCARCPRAFGSVWDSSLTFFQQVVAGDSWGTVSLPIIEEEWWTAFFFLAVLVSVSLAMLNLILAVICEAATEARQQSLHDKAEEHQRQMHMHRQRVLDLCGEMDCDKSGSVSFAELMEGWDMSKDFADTFIAMDIKKEDMEMIFNVLDTDGSGDVRYEEFVDQLHMLKTNEMRLILFTVMGIRCQVEERFKSLQDMLPGGQKEEGKEGSTQEAAPEESKEGSMQAVSAASQKDEELKPVDVETKGQQPVQQNVMVPEESPICGSSAGPVQTKAGASDDIAKRVMDDLRLSFKTEDMDRLIKANEELVRSVKGFLSAQMAEASRGHGYAQGESQHTHHVVGVGLAAARAAVGDSTGIRQDKALRNNTTAKTGSTGTGLPL